MTCTGGKCGKYTVVFGAPGFVGVLRAYACNRYQAAFSPPLRGLGTRLLKEIIIFMIACKLVIGNYKGLYNANIWMSTAL